MSSTPSHAPAPSGANTTDASSSSAPTPEAPRRGRLSGDFAQQSAGLSPASAPGFDAQLAALSPVQCSADGAGHGGGAVGAIAAHGTQGSGGVLPHAGIIQRAFGRHDIGGVSFHQGGAATAANQALGSKAYASGDKVAAAGSGLDLHTAAHEAAHVIQQRGGVQLKGGIGAAGDAYERHADAVADAVVAGKSAEELLDRAPIGGGATTGVQLKGGRVTKVFNKGKLKLSANQTIDYDVTGSGFRMKITINKVDGHPLDTPVVVSGGEALTLSLQLEDVADHELVVVDEPERQRRTGREMLRLARERHASKGEDNPDTAGGTDNSYFSQPVATGLASNGDLTVELNLHTLNKWDRVSWKCRLGERWTVKEDKSWWNNPAWDATTMRRSYPYDFKHGFTAISEGSGSGGVRRTITATIPGDQLKRVFGADLSRLDEASIICFGMEVCYGGGGPTTATREEFEAAYTATTATRHQYGLGATSSPESYGYVDLSGLGLAKGVWATDEEIRAQDIADNPSPNIKLPVPDDYEHADLIKDLKPEAGMKIATRIENEATLGVSSLDKLKDIVLYLASLEHKSGSVAALMAGDDTLEQFDWTVTPVEDNSMVFTDVYLDDPAFHALKSGIGIRKRSSDTATKLNVKTGPGYQVGKLDKDNEETEEKSAIYRRHEIGYDLHPDASIEDIGAFLDKGTDGSDPWNRGAEQANLAATGGPIDFSSLAGQMVLQGDRKKFNLKAVHREKGGAINIEISCDHTVGRKFEDYSRLEKPEDLFDGTVSYDQCFNVEMELEHLGATAPSTKKPEPTSTSTGGLDTAVDAGLSGELSKAEAPPTTPKKRAPMGHPGRLYMREDAANPKFNTESFEVFAKAQARMIAGMRTALSDSDGLELNEDRQKLETLFAAIYKQTVTHAEEPKRKTSAKSTKSLKPRPPKRKGRSAKSASSSVESIDDRVDEGQVQGSSTGREIRVVMAPTEQPSMDATVSLGGVAYRVVGLASDGTVSLSRL